MATGSAPSGGRRRSENARFGCLLFMWFVMFGLGFLAGISATKRAARGPVWLQSLFGIAPGSPLAPAPTPPPALVASNVPVNTAPPPTSVPAPNPTPTQPPANTQPTPAPNTQPTNTSPLDRSQPSTTDPSTSHDPTPPVKPSAELDGKVKDYNRALKRIQDAYKTYEATKKVTEPEPAGGGFQSKSKVAPFGVLIRVPAEVCSMN